ncbi:Hypothetical protein J6897_03909 [Nakaseomyces glabratus]
MGIVGREKMVSHCRALSEKRSYLVFPELTTSLSPKQKIFFFLPSSSLSELFFGRHSPEHPISHHISVVYIHSDFRR